LTPAENKVVSNVGDIERVNRIFREAGGPSKVSEAIAVLKTYPRNKAVSMRLVTSAAANAVAKLGGPNKATVAVAVNEKIVQARKRARKSKVKVVVAAPQVRATLLKSLVKKFTKNELVKIAGKNVLGGSNKKNNLVKSFTKYVRRQPTKKKRGSVHGPKPKKTKK
jgi:sulfur carrier protein ThiS